MSYMDRMITFSRRMQKWGSCDASPSIIRSASSLNGVCARVGERVCEKVCVRERVCEIVCVRV